VRIRSERLTWRQIGDELVALDLESSTYFTANSTAAVIIRLLADGADRSKLVDGVLAEFDVALDTAEADVDAFLATLDEHGLLDHERSERP
jgi:hypothetical protein